MTENQNTVVYLMFLNGILFLGLNFIAYSIIFPGPARSKRIGYTLVTAVISAFSAQQEYRALISIGLQPENVRETLIGGFIIPVFFISTVYYRIKKSRIENKQTPLDSRTKNHENH